GVRRARRPPAAALGAGPRLSPGDRSRHGRRGTPADTVARPGRGDPVVAGADSLGTNARRLPADEPLRRHPPAGALTVAATRGGGPEQRAGWPSAWPADRRRRACGGPPAPRDGERGRLHAPRRRVRPGQFDRPAAGLPALPSPRPRRAAGARAWKIRALRP